LLEEAGLKEATAKRYVENSVGAIRMFELSGMDNATPEMVREFLDDSWHRQREQAGQGHQGRG
jgi:hypothetical protein